MNRRSALRLGVGGLLSLALPSEVRASTASGLRVSRGPLGPLRPGSLAVAERVRWAVVQRAGELGSDGVPVLPQPDGMACFEVGGQLVLLRNHELTTLREMEAYVPGVAERYAQLAPIDAPIGGVSRVVIDPKKLDRALRAGRDASSAVIDSRLVLSGSLDNCAGGVCEGEWVSCEESDEPEHGFALRVSPGDTERVEAASRRLASWGRFRREAIAWDPSTGIVYQTEDHKDGFLYRHVPDGPAQGAGRLQALHAGLAHTNSGAAIPVGEAMPARWIDVPDPSAGAAPCREQIEATRFCRGEGIVWDGRRAIFVASTAGPQSAGQVFSVDADSLTLLAEVRDRSALSMPDNLAVAPWGGLVVCEDNYDDVVPANYLRVLEPDGSIWDLARNDDPARPPDSPAGAEFAGACWSPDGRFLFVNQQGPLHTTIAFSARWPR